MHIITGPAVHEDNESFQFQNDILRYVYCSWQWQGDKTGCDLWPCKPGLMRISFHGWRSNMLRRSRWMPERTTILRPSEKIVRGNLVDQDVSEILTSSESRVAPSLVNPGNKQQLAQRYLYQLFLSSPTLTCTSIWVSASSCEHVWSPSVFWPSLELTTLSNRVDTMTLSHVSMETRSSPRNWKSSSLLSSFRKTFSSSLEAWRG